MKFILIYKNNTLPVTVIVSPAVPFDFETDDTDGKLQVVNKKLLFDGLAMVQLAKLIALPWQLLAGACAF